MSELASPYSTGGGGGDFETRVLAYYLGCVLTQAIPRGLPDATASSVSSQALYQGTPLDDILVRANRGDGEAQLALQVKRDLTFGEENEEVQDVMRRAWETFTASAFHEDVDRCGVALGLYSKKIDEHYTTVLTWARNATTAADFLVRVAALRLASQTQRTFLALVRTLLDRAAGRAITDDELWRFCRSFVLLHFDLQSEGSRDAAQLRSILQNALNIDAAQRARDLELKLFEFASTMKLSAGTHSTVTLRETLATEQFALRPARQVVADLQRLREYGRFILNDIGTTAGGVALPRTQHVQRAAAEIAQGRVVALSGEPGTGKSGVLRLLIDQARAESSALLLSGDRLDGTDWPTFAQHLGLTSSLHDLLRAIATSAAPCVFIDGLDRVTTARDQRIVNDLLRAIAEVSVTDARSWMVVFTSRTQNLPHVMSWVALPANQAAQTIEVATLTDEEFEVTAAQQPSLALLDGDERLRPITRNLFMVSRLTDPRVAATLPTQGVQTELDLASVWWTHVVGAGGGDGLARQALLVDLAADLLREERTNGPYDAAALHSLESDRIVSRDNFGVVRFTHDLFEDWVLARLLGQKGAQLPAFLATVSAPFRLQRGVRLLGALLLQDGHTERWRQLLVGIEGDAALKERWQQTFVSSPLLSARATALLDEIQPLLLEGAAERTRALLTATVTLDVGPNVFWGSMLRALPARPELAALFMHEPTPRWAIWIPLVTWLTAHADAIPGPLRRDAARVLELWQAHAPEGSILRGEVADTALRWFTDHADLGQMSEDAQRRYFTTLRKIIFASADVRPDPVKEIVRGIAEHRHDGARRQLVEAGAALSKHIPSDYVDAILTMVIRERDRERHRLIDDLDFDDRPFYPASYAKGPFIHLLKSAEAEGLRLIHTLANTALDRWREEEDPTPAAIVLQLANGPQEFFGTGREYMWFRSDGMAPPSVVSALMALEFWMEQEVERGRDPVGLFETVLAGSRCLAVPGLCLGIALAYPEKCLTAALPIVAVPHFWLLDVARMSSDSTGSFGILLPGDDIARTLNEDRDKRPQRRQSIRDLAIRYLCSPDDDLTERFTAAVAAFAEHPPIFFEEQRDDDAYLDEMRVAMEREMEFGKVENYRRTEQDGQTIIYFEKPQYLVERDAADMERHTALSRRMGLLLWAEKTIKARAVEASWTVDDAVQAASEFGGAEALRQPIEEDDDFTEGRGGRAVAAVAAAAAITAPDWLRRHERIEWCIDVLDAASRASGSALDGHVATAIIPNDPHDYAVRGFAALIGAGVQDERIRTGLLRLSIDRRLRVVAVVAAMLRPLWTADRALAWEIIALGIESNLTSPYHGYSYERDPDRDAALLAPHIAALEQGTLSTLPRVTVDNDEFFAYGFLYLAQGIPIDLLWSDADARTPLITLTEDLIAWTVGMERAASARDQYVRTFPDEWDGVFSGWLARLAGVADDESYDRVIRAAMEDAATEPLPIVPEYLQSYMWAHFDQQIPELACRRWAAYVRWLLQTAHVAEYRDQSYVSREVEDMVSLIIFMRYGSPLFKPTWTCAAEFAPVIADWTNAVAPAERGFSKLLLLLERFAPNFAPSDVVAWLTRFASGQNGIDPAKLAGDYGERTAHALNSIWSKQRTVILESRELRAQYGALVDALLAAGVALAGALAERLRAT
ncbi:MAG TPA: AAA family ATPase [Thermoanaerobaculia bacterium]